MKKLMMPIVFLFVLFLLSLPIAHATDVNCPEGGEPNLDEIITDMMESMATNPEIEFYDDIVIDDSDNDCSDLAPYEIECLEIENGWWREWRGYISVTARYAGYNQTLYWERSETNSDEILDAQPGMDDENPIYFTAGDAQFYFKDVTDGGTWYSVDSKNQADGGQRHMVAYRLGNDTFVCAFEDLGIPAGDGDFQDLVFLITHAAPSCIPVIGNIDDQAIPARGSFQPIDLDEAVLDGDYSKASIIWSWEGPPGGTISVSFAQDPANDDHWMATITYPYDDWTGTEEITFTATTPGPDPGPDGHSFTSEPVTFTVAEPDAPLVYDISDQVIRNGTSFQKIYLDNYVDPPPNYEDSDVEWTTTGGDKISVTIDANRIADITYPTYWRGSEIITFMATVNPSGSTGVRFTILGGAYGGGPGITVGGVAAPVDKLDLVAPWIGLIVLMTAMIALVVIWRKKRGTTRLS